MITITKINKKELFLLLIHNKIISEMIKKKSKKCPIKILKLKLITCFKTNLNNKNYKKNNQF
jgi:hypothetical protein